MWILGGAVAGVLAFEVYGLRFRFFDIPAAFEMLNALANAMAASVCVGAVVGLCVLIAKRRREHPTETEPTEAPPVAINQVPAPVIKVRCSYCATLNDEGCSVCPHCGARM